MKRGREDRERAIERERDVVLPTVSSSKRIV